MLPWESVFAGTYILPPDDKTVKRDSFEEKKRGGGTHKKAARTGQSRAATRYL